MLGECGTAARRGRDYCGDSFGNKTSCAYPGGNEGVVRKPAGKGGRKVHGFQAEVFDESGKIGEGEHERFLVRAERFQQKADAKGNLQQGKEQEING